MNKCLQMEWNQWDRCIKHGHEINADNVVEPNRNFGTPLTYWPFLQSYWKSSRALTRIQNVNLLFGQADDEEEMTTDEEKDAKVYTGFTKKNVFFTFSCPSFQDLLIDCKRCVQPISGQWGEALYWKFSFKKLFTGTPCTRIFYSYIIIH